MTILTIRTDKPQAEIGLFQSHNQLAYQKWQAHRELATTIHKELDKLLNKSSKSLKDIEGIVCFKGPGSFTGLRIGLSAGNALAYGLNIPIAASSGEDWIKTGIKDLLGGKTDNVAMPDYGAPAKTTTPK